MKIYKEGHKVMLVLTGVAGLPPDLEKHDQEIYRISKVHKFGPNDAYYELNGLKSKLGVPYSVHSDWLYDIQAWTG